MNALNRGMGVVLLLVFFGSSFCPPARGETAEDLAIQAAIQFYVQQSQQAPIQGAQIIQAARANAGAYVQQVETAAQGTIRAATAAAANREAAVENMNAAQVATIEAAAQGARAATEAAAANATNMALATASAQEAGARNWLGGAINAINAYAAANINATYWNSIVAWARSVTNWVNSLLVYYGWGWAVGYFNWINAEVQAMYAATVAAWNAWASVQIAVAVSAANATIAAWSGWAWECRLFDTNITVETSLSPDTPAHPPRQQSPAPGEPRSREGAQTMSGASVISIPLGLKT